MPKLTYFVENSEANTLSHYGRLGMKWGQHIFGKEPTSRVRKKRKYLSETSPDKKGEHVVKSNSSKVALSKFEEGVSKLSKDPKAIKELRADVDRVMNAARIKDKKFSEDAFNVWRHDSYRDMLESSFANDEKGFFRDTHKFLSSISDSDERDKAYSEIAWYADTNLSSDKYEEAMYPYMEYLKKYPPKETVHVIRMSENVEYDGNSLTHYGRLGMKWGQHIFGRDKMGAKVTKRLGKYEKKADAYRFKSAKAERKAAKGASAKIRTDISIEKYRKNTEKALKYKVRSEKAIAKGKKFASNANKVFGTDPVSGLSAEQIAIGERFALQFVKKR